MLNQLLNKLIKSSAGQARFVMAIVGLSVAIILILSAVQVQVNYYDLLNSKINRDSVANFLVINKALTDQNVGASSLSNQQIKELEKQNFVEAVGNLTVSRYKASIQSNSSRFPFYTDIAFESVPSEFVDVNTADWHWDEQANYLPIIVPNQFLDFYNFQYSFSQNLPQLTPQVVKMVLFKVSLQGSGKTISMNGKVVGFSNRISSMLVPQSFMDWANQTFATTEHSQNPSRVIIKTKDPGSPELTAYLKQQGFTTDADKTRFSRYRQVVDFVVNISGITGMMLLAFALLIFTLFIQLTIESCKEEIALLLLLGNSPGNLTKFLMKRFFTPNLYIVLISLLLIAVSQYFLSEWLQSKQIFINSMISWYSIAVAIILLLIIALVNYKTIQKYLGKSYSR